VAVLTANLNLDEADFMVQKQWAMCIGDSLISNGWGSTSTVKALKSRGWQNWVAVNLGQRIWIQDSFAVGGTTASDIITQYTDNIAVLSDKPGFLFISMGGNDLLSDDSQAAVDALKRDMDSLLTAVTSDGIIPIVLVGGAVDASLTDALRAAMYDYQTWLIAYAANKGNIVLVDGFTTLLDPLSLSGKPRAGTLFDDNVHFSTTAAQRIGAKGAETLSKLILNTEKWYVSLNDDHGPNANIVSNALMTGTAGTLGSGVTGVIADGWSSLTSGGVSMVGSKVAADADDDFQGDWQQLTLSGGAANSTGLLFATENTDYEIGDNVVSQMEIEATGLTEITGVYLEFLCKNSGGSILARSRSVIMNDVAEEMDDFKGVLRTSALVIPTDTVQVQIVLHSTATSAATSAGCTVKLRRNSTRPELDGTVPVAP